MKNYLAKLLLLSGKTGIELSQKGSALILTMFILAGMMIVALSGSYVVLVGIKSSGVQSQSVKAYFMAEAGAERLLYELRKKSTTYGENSVSSVQPVLEEEFPDANAGYHVFFMNRMPIMIYHSIGTHQQTKRNVELRVSN
jgi:hypothetical protein